MSDIKARELGKILGISSTQTRILARRYGFGYVDDLGHWWFTKADVRRAKKSRRPLGRPPKRRP